MSYTKQATCAERIGAELAEREAELARLYELIDEGEGEESDRAQEEIYEKHYGVEVAKVYRVIWSGGGPADWIEITCDANGSIVKVEYVFQDWFDGARKEVQEGSAVYRYAEAVLDMLEA